MSFPEPGHIIVGAGQAGAKAAQSLRREGHLGPITLIGAEADAPYSRPVLSKEYLYGSSERGSINILSDGWYERNSVDLLLGTRVSHLDPENHRVVLSTGEDLGYEKLLLATGSRARRLTLPGADLDAVLYLRTVGDSDRIRHALSTASRVVIIGGGWIGLEIAAASRMRDVEVTLLEAAPLPLLQSLGPEVAQHFAALHVSRGVDLRCNVEVTGLTGDDGRVTGVDLADGAHIDAEVVIVGIGVTPRTELAELAGLAVDNGVLVDAGLRSSHPDVFAAGDIASAWHPLLGERIRVEHWTNASWQPRVAARGMLGLEASYDSLPHFFTEQYDLSMEYAGHVGAQGYDEVVFRGDPESESYIAFWLKDNRLLAGMNVNMPGAVRKITALVRSGQRFTVSQLADSTQPLGALLNT